MSQLLSQQCCISNALAVVVVHRKGIIEYFNDFGIALTYYKFRISATASNDSNTTFGDWKAANGLIQIVSDINDIHIHSQNQIPHWKFQITCGLKLYEIKIH